MTDYELMGIVLISPDPDIDESICEMVASIKESPDEVPEKIKELLKEKINVSDVIATFGQFDFALIVEYTDIASLKRFVLSIRAWAKEVCGDEAAVRTITVPGIKIKKGKCKEDY